MADKKPDAKKAGGAKPSGGGGSGGGHLFEIEVTILLVVTFIVIIYLATGRYVLQSLGYSQEDSMNRFSSVVIRGLEMFNSLFNIIVFFSVFLILLFILGSIYFKHKHKESVTLYKMGLPKGHVASLSSTANVSAAMREDSSTDSVDVGPGIAGGKAVLNPSGENKKWDDIQKHMASMNSSDWRMAILEADILLYEMLDQMGYDGDTVADKLKLIETSDFNNLDSAWRAHKVRNTIAHEGASYELSYQQAQNTIDLYRKVFEEFYFI